jgi:hypothetical protein
MLNIAGWLWTSGNEAVGGPGWRIVLRFWPFPDRLGADFRAGANFVLTAFSEVPIRNPVLPRSGTPNRNGPIL